MPSIGVVIVSYNTRDLLRACLLSLHTCTLPLHVVVVDNLSPDQSAAMVAAEFPAVQVVEPGDNLGFAGGTNAGIAQMLDSTDLVLLLNPDTVVHHGAIEALVAFLDQHPRVGAVSPRLLNPDGTLQPAAFRFPTVLMTLLDLFPPGEVLPGRLYGSHWHGRYPHEQGVAPFAIDHPLGACILTRASVLRGVGLLDATYFMYAEEIDWARRVRAAGWAIWQVPAARVTHVGGASTSQFRARMLVELYTARLQYFARYERPLTLGLHRAIIQLGMLRLALRAWWAYLWDDLRAEDLRARLWAYGTVSRL